ncbi:hypothetical protein LTS15_011131 [Exophiala xenobiotica]|nr:hypothetical protein LTS15_011131 [Exophiala xenobiotica]
MASSVITETLRSVTSTKIKELKKQREQYEISKGKILRDAKAAASDLKRTNLLLREACREAGILFVDEGLLDPDTHASATATCRRRDQQLFLCQAEKDPALAPSFIQEIEQVLLEHFELKSVRHEHAEFFSELATEWLSSSEESKLSPVTTGAMDDSSFETVGRKEMHEQRAQWESVVFSKSNVDVSCIKNYLQKLFNANKVVSNAFRTVQNATRSEALSMWRDTVLFDLDNLRTTIQGLLKSDLLSEEKAAIVKSFKSNDEVLQEVADVLTMRMASLETWQWSTANGAITVSQRRQLNGKYRVFMDEDILDALLLHAIGMKWAVHFRHQFLAFFHSHAWMTPGTRVPKHDQDRRSYYLGQDSVSHGTVETIRRSQYERDYFMTQLPDSEPDGVRGYGDEDDQATSPSRKSPLETKQSLLHLLITEALTARHLRPTVPHAVIRSDFHWFGPSLPHETIFAVLEFLGMPEEWLHFFRKFLQAPMRFGQDGPDGQSQVRQTGVPMSHALSDVFGEVILFIMDFAVNRATAGSYLYRLHDDFWFWGTQDLCERGWEAMTEFASTMGIRFNKEKTGSVVFAERNMALHIDVLNGSDLDSDGHQPITKVAQLPEGEVRWGFLRLDPAATRFVIDQTMVDEHIAELRLQLSHRTSIFSYVQAYNAYLARFFSNNFGKPSYAFGPQHIDNMIDTFAKIQRAIFPSGNVTEYLAQLARDRFGVEDIPDGVWYWPVRMGGLELRNPMAPLFCMRETLRQTPEQILTEQLEAEESAYESAKVRFGRSNSKELRDARLTAGLSTAAVREDFMSKEEFMRYREERSVYLGNAYQTLLSIPQEYEISETSNIASWLDDLPVSSRNSKPSSGIVRSFGSMQPYWKWVLAVYGAQIVKKYGSLQMVDATQVPLGVVSVMQSGRVRWQG